MKKLADSYINKSFARKLHSIVKEKQRLFTNSQPTGWGKWKCQTQCVAVVKMAKSMLGISKKGTKKNTVNNAVVQIYGEVY